MMKKKMTPAPKGNMMSQSMKAKAAKGIKKVASEGMSEVASKYASNKMTPKKPMMKKK
jgi:hypothetical protein